MKMLYIRVVTKANFNTQRKLISTIVRKELCKMSNLLMRTDEPKAAKINEEVNRLIKSANINFVENGNIKRKQLGKRGLHLNIQDNKTLARNLLNAIRN